MKQFNAVKQLFIVALLCAVSTANGQIHPLAFSTGTNVNWYANYVGLRLQVTYPAVIAGDKFYTYAYTGTSPWGGQVTTPIVNDTVIMDATSDSFGCSPFGISMTNKIAVIWRGPLGSSACEFGYKALQAQNAGAKAVVLINEYPGAGPVGMAAGASGGSVTIPVFMISNPDGIALSAQYRSGSPVTITITPWGLGLRNDIGFVPGGAAAWHACAVPSDQLTPGTSPAPYKGLDGAFIANYGTSDAKNVKVAATLKYTPTGGATTQLHTDTISGEATFTGLAHTPTPSDSIVAMFSTNEYNVAPSTAGTGKYDLTYTIMSDTPNQSKIDTSLTISFYASDSVYSKGRYDFVNKGPISTIWEGPAATPPSDFVWGPMYYVANAGDAVRTLQFSLYNGGGTLGDITSGPMNLFVFKWVDGSGGQPADSVVQNGELTLVSQGSYTFKPGDTSGMVFTLPAMLDPLTGHAGDHAPWLDANSWYYVAAEVSATYFLGCDGGTTDPYPRIYGRFHKNGYLEYSNIEWTGDYSVGSNTMTSSPTANNAICAFSGVSFIQSVDSFNYASQKGLIPSISMIVTKTPDTSHLHDAVAGIAKPLAYVTLFPNPTDDNLNVSVELEKPASSVTYTIIDGLGRFVRKETHYNVDKETFNIKTSTLAQGVYYLVVNANGGALSRKFTIVR